MDVIMCELYYPDPFDVRTKRCRNCDRVINSPKPIEAYRTVMCGHYKPGPIWNGSLSKTITAPPQSEKSKEKKPCNCGAARRMELLAKKRAECNHAAVVK
jgi:hypothetical protein